MNDESLKYAIIVEPASGEEEGYYACFPDLPGCMGDGDTPEEAMADARLAFAAWMEVQADRFDDLPEPGFAIAVAHVAREKMVERICELEQQLEEANARIAALAAIESQKGGWTASKSYRVRDTTSSKKRNWSSNFASA